MIARILATVTALLFAIGAFCGLGLGHAGPLNPFGLLFLFIAALMWDEWGIIAEDNKDYLRAYDDHYRRDGQQYYRETENLDLRNRRP